VKHHAVMPVPIPLATENASPLEWSEPQIRELVEQATTLMVDAQKNLDTALPTEPEPPWQELVRPPQECATSAGPLLELFARAANSSYDHRAPGFLGYVPSSGLATSAIAKMIASTFNCFTGVPDHAPALVRMEHALMRWVCELFGLPPTAIGTMTSGTSMATLIVVVTARQHRLGDHFAQGTAYVTAHTHQCVAKALRIAGLPPGAVRTVSTDDEGRMDPDAAVKLITADRRAGKQPFLLAATAGTTNTGSIDPLPELAALADTEQLWLHVDAAYGGGFQLTQRGRTRMNGIERADSIALDPSKSWFLPFGTGVLLVRDAATLHHTFAERHDYMTDLDKYAEVPSYTDLGPELSREYRALQLWLPFHLHGIAAFRDTLNTMLDLAQHAHHRLTAIPHLRTGPPPQLSIITFRLRDGTDQDNRDLLRRINRTGQAYLSGSVIDNRYTLRLVLLNHRLHRDHLDQTLNTIAATCGPPRAP
jgi:aromatic-L-amino-acid/L-tryptophan decarboxylase